MGKSNSFTISDFYCTECGKKGLPIARRAGAQRESGHLKKLYCIYCGREVNHAEVRPFGEYNYEDFKMEFELGRFVDGLKVPISELIECTKEVCEYNVDGRCWNCQKDFKCIHRGRDKEEE